MTGFTHDAYRYTPDAYPAWLDETTATPACRGTNLEIWFPETRNVHRATARARAICQPCPLLDTCRDWALRQPADQLHGIWGGMSQHQRAQHHRARQSAA